MLAAALMRVSSAQVGRITPGVFILGCFGRCVTAVRRLDEKLGGGNIMPLVFGLKKTDRFGTRSRSRSE